MDQESLIRPVSVRSIHPMEKYIYTALISHGCFRPRMIHRRRILFVFLSLVILVTLPCYESRARNTQSTQKLIRNRLPNYAEDNWEKENVHIEQRDKSWVSISMHKKDNYVQESSLVNFTYNHTKDGQQLVHNEQSLTHRRFKRGVIHLYNMVVCATGCNPLAYKGYGCYCGFLGSGYVIDGIDRCCKMHDWCYDATECPMFSEYFVPYYWRCYHGYKPVCAVEHGSWGGSGSCAQRLCECDRSFAECLKRYPCPTTKAVCTSSPWRLVQNLFMIM